MTRRIAYTADRTSVSPIEAPALILASASPSRRQLLENTGLEFSVRPAAVDEEEIKRSMRAGDATPDEIAMALAEIKALRISRQSDQALVIGADQIMQCEGTYFDKPTDLDHAFGHLTALRGKLHRLHNAVTVAKDGSIIWRQQSTASLRMRRFSDEFLHRYLELLGPTALTSVGAYQVEGLGIHLFDQIDGDFFAILGLPVLPLLMFLREHQVAPN